VTDLQSSDELHPVQDHADSAPEIFDETFEDVTPAEPINAPMTIYDIIEKMDEEIDQKSITQEWAHNLKVCAREDRDRNKRMKDLTTFTSIIVPDREGLTLQFRANQAK
jgi:hypothetical protein